MRSRAAGGFAKDGESARTTTSEKGNETTIYYLLNLKLLKTTKEEYSAKCSHSKFCHSRRCLVPSLECFPSLSISSTFLLILSESPAFSKLHEPHYSLVCVLGVPLLYCVYLGQASMQCISECLPKWTVRALGTETEPYSLLYHLPSPAQYLALVTNAVLHAELCKWWDIIKNSSSCLMAAKLT